MKPTVFIPELIAPCGLDLLRAECDCLVPWEGSIRLSAQSMVYDESQLNPGLSEADGIIVRLFKIDRQALFKAHRLKDLGAKVAPQGFKAAADAYAFKHELVMTLTAVNISC